MTKIAGLEEIAWFTPAFYNLSNFKKIIVICRTLTVIIKKTVRIHFKHVCTFSVIDKINNSRYMKDVI